MGSGEAMATIEAEVIRILDHALVVLLPDGRKGRIRKREISWNELVDPSPPSFMWVNESKPHGR
jgi:hypothetical protein